MFLVAGNIVVQRTPNSQLVKAQIPGEDTRTITNLFKIAEKLNKPHLDRLNDLFDWLDSDQSTNNSTAEDIRSILQFVKKAPPPNATPEQIKTNTKKNWLLAYNSYYDVVYLPEDLDLE